MINYFDLGTHKNGTEINMFLRAVQNMDVPYNIYGFEAHPDLAQQAAERYAEYPEVKIYNIAISDKNEKIELYLNRGRGLGNSIFKTKNNVDAKKFVEVEGVVFSDWVRDNKIDLTMINILRFNIEGAELHLMNDLVLSGLYKDIDLILAPSTGGDILKCKETKPLYGYYIEMLKRHNIRTIFFKRTPRNIQRSSVRRLRYILKMLVALEKTFQKHMNKD
jgi:FkbM family methyltransferase